MDWKKRIISFILGFFMCLSFAATATGTGALFGFVNKGAIVGAFSEASTYDDVRENIINTVDYEGAPKGTDRLVIEAVITKDIVRENLTDQITGVPWDSSMLIKSYYFNMSDLLPEKNIVITKEVDEQIDDFLDKLRGHYIKQIAAVQITPFNQIKDFVQPVAFGMTVLGITGCCLCFGALFTFVKDNKDKLFPTGIGCIGGGLITIGFPSYFIMTGMQRRLNLYAGYLDKALEKFIFNGLITINFLGFAVLAAGIVIAVTDMVNRCKKAGKSKA